MARKTPSSGPRVSRSLLVSEIGMRKEFAKQAGGFTEYTQVMQDRIKASGRGLSVASVHAVVPPDDPDFVRLLEMVDGIPILTAEDFTPNLRPPPLRDKYAY